MPEYFGAPYAQTFAIPCSLDECAYLISLNNGKRLRRRMKSRSSPGVFDIVMTTNKIDETRIEFSGYAEYKLFSALQMKRKPHVYGDIYIQGHGHWNGYQTIISYDFYHIKGKKPFLYNLIPQSVYEFYIRMSYGVFF